MTDYMEMKEDLEKLGFDISPGCRIEAFEYANEIGISMAEILMKFSDQEVLEAIHDSARVMGMLSELSEQCSVCGEEDDLMECDCCGELFCYDCGIFPGDERYCSEECAACKTILNQGERK